MYIICVCIYIYIYIYKRGERGVGGVGGGGGLQEIRPTKSIFKEHDH